MLRTSDRVIGVVMRPRLQDVADSAGVSLKTVSNVFNDYPHIRPETRERVLQAATQLGYRPNLSARNLARGRTGVIALALPALDMPYFAELLSDIMRAAQKRSWAVIVEQTEGDPEQEERILRGELAHDIDGLIISPLSATTEQIKSAAARIPLVLLGEHHAHRHADHISINNVAAARQATAHLIRAGHKKIGVIGPRRLDSRRQEPRLRGYAEALRSAGLPVDPGLMRAVPDNRGESGAAAMADLLTERPDAVFCFTDLLALGAMRTLHQRGLRVPDDVALAGFDDIPYGRVAAPSLTTICPDRGRIAETAIRMLDERVSGAESSPPRQIRAPFTLVVRESSQ